MHIAWITAFRLTGAVVIAASLSLGTFAGDTVSNLQRTDSSGRPNIVLVVADDLSWHDIGCYGNKDVRTPNVDKLATQGVRFSRFYAPAPMCAPLRQALFTGIYPVRNGAYPNHSYVKPGTLSMPHHLKPLGYRVGLVGKTHFGPPECFPFEFPHSSRTSKGTGQKASGGGDGEEGAELPLDFAAMDEFVARDRSQPFCLVVASQEPHSPWNLGDAAVYQQDKLQLPPYLVDTPSIRRNLARYYAEVAVLDTEVGRVMSILDRHGLADNTILIFMSEQGSSVPFGKWTLYEAGIHGGVLIRWPGVVQAGRVSPALLSYVDILPTLIEAAGGKAPAELDGRSFLNTLRGGSDAGNEYVFAEQTSRGIGGGRNQLFGIRCVRDARYKLIRNLNPGHEMQGAAVSTAKSWLKEAKPTDQAFAMKQTERYLRRPPLELYDLEADPWEMNNLADDPAQAETVRRLNGILDAWMKAQGDQGAATEEAAFERQRPGLSNRR